MRRNAEKDPRKKRKQTPTAKIIFLLSIFIIAQIIFINSDFFRLRTIIINGADRIPHDEIVKIAQFPLGRNILSLPLSPYREKIAGMLWIKKVAIVKILPGGVRIDVVERHPVISIVGDNEDEKLAVDEEGVVLCPLSEVKVKGLPTLLVHEDLKIGDRIEKTHIDLITKSLTWLTPGIGERISSFSIEKNLNVSFNYLLTEGKVEVRLGTLENVPQKMEILSKIIKEMEGKGKRLVYVDLRYKEPVVRLDEGPSRNGDAPAAPVMSPEATNTPQINHQATLDRENQENKGQ